MTEEEKPETLDEKVVRMFLAGELASVSCPIDELDNASCPIHVIENSADRRTVKLESSCQLVPVARIRRLIFDAIATTGERAFNLAYRLKDDEDMARMVREARSLGTLKVFEANGHGTIHGDDVLRGSIERADFETWLAVEWHLALSDGGDASEETTADQPVPASEPAAEQDPLPLTTGDIAFSFDGIKWSEQEWKKPLGDKPKWLAACVAIPGQQGVRETRWNPVQIAVALVNGGYAKANSVRARFQTKPPLKPWLDAWKTYEADYLDNL